MTAQQLYLFSFSEDLVSKTPGNCRCWVTGSLTCQGDLIIKLRSSLVTQVGNVGLD